jgi:N-methylhydantoinase A
VGEDGGRRIRSGGWQVGLDIGGTFTDVIAVELRTATIRSAKVKSSANNPIEGLLDGLKAVGLAWDDVDDLIHGTTIVTNAIVEGAFARVAFIATEGFSDVLAIGRQNRRYLYRLDLLPKLPAQVPEELRFELHERVTHEGTIETPLTDAAIDRLISSMRECRVEAVAVSLLHAYANSTHEQLLGDRLQQLFRHVALSHRVNPEAREFERGSTTALSAGVMPLIADYVDRLEEARPQNSRLHFFHSASGMCSGSVMRELPLGLALSGPAAGVTAASRVARDIGADHAISFDMGGTTTDTCMIVHGHAEIANDRTLGGRPLRMPAVAVESIGAGGGSIARYDGSILQIGPDSAGAAPGPACYGLGGTRPTISDANMVLGYLEDGATFGGNIRLDRRAAEKVLAPLAQTLGLSLAETALGIVRVANNTMSGALHRVTVERGVDARSCKLIAFGGAGPMHAAEVARIAGIRQVVIPEHSSTFSALGCLRADFSYTQQQTISMGNWDWDGQRLDRLRASMQAQLRKTVADLAIVEPVSTWVAAIRYVGQSSSVEIADPDFTNLDRLGEAFRARHNLLYGFATDERWGLIALRLTVSVPRHAFPATASAIARGAPTPTKTRVCTFDGPNECQTPEYQRATLSPGHPISGPAIVTDEFSTIVLPPGSSLTADEFNHLHIDMGHAG